MIGDEVIAETDEDFAIPVSYPDEVNGVIIEINDADKFSNEDLELFNVHKNYDHSTFPVGACIVTVIDGVMYGNFTLYEDCNGLYPAIGYQMLTDKKYKLVTIGLCENPNEDERIKPLNY